MTMAQTFSHQKKDTLHHPRLVYHVPGMEQAHVYKDQIYKTVEEVHLHCDIYYPADYDYQHPLPAVLLIHADGEAAQLERAKDTDQIVGWAQLITTRGMIAVTANHRSTYYLRNVVGVANDIDDLFSYIREHGTSLHINTEALGIWTCSTGSIFALRLALGEAPLGLRALTGYYSFTDLQSYYNVLLQTASPNNDSLPAFTDEDFDEFSASSLLHHHTHVAPILLARAGFDTPELNKTLDQFIVDALAHNVELTVLNHPTGQHGFDMLDDQGRTYELIQTTLAFFASHLLH